MVLSPSIIYWSVLKGGTLFLLVSLDIVQSNEFIVFNMCQTTRVMALAPVSSSSVIGWSQQRAISKILSSFTEFWNDVTTPHSFLHLE